MLTPPKVRQRFAKPVPAKSPHIANHDARMMKWAYLQAIRARNRALAGLSIVFDSKFLGKWMYDWTVVFNQGASCL
ncbi:hypothetical protein GJ744_003342 [Endocarpon pusillum]|uniref:Uncharacterized protein n=1 Tax=Endocarpon pusillum TaxID=364733 RepID=A0A8H7A9S3_9EURO|nr:hypothetical protein GJ744_003342 [Endocarpon pusillum]